MVAAMGVWDIAAILFIVATPLALIGADYGSVILAAVRRRRQRMIRLWPRHHR
jgi:hypothetical protein